MKMMRVKMEKKKEKAMDREKDNRETGDAGSWTEYRVTNGPRRKWGKKCSLRKR